MICVKPTTTNYTAQIFLTVFLQKCSNTKSEKYMTIFVKILTAKLLIIFPITVIRYLHYSSKCNQKHKFSKLYVTIKRYHDHISTTHWPYDRNLCNIKLSHKLRTNHTGKNKRNQKSRQSTSLHGYQPTKPKF